MEDLITDLSLCILSVSMTVALDEALGYYCFKRRGTRVVLVCRCDRFVFEPLIFYFEK